jgi:crotonobetainyl-CoA:carnitine CoA-transferase CaiB-like acyl-CoA transferase
VAAPFDGIRVIDLSSVISGPYTSHLLAEYGADVIKVETRDGDLMRWIGGRTPAAGTAPKFLHMNKNKRSIVLDLKQKAGRVALLRLVAKADVLLHNMRPDAMTRLGLDYADVVTVNPAIIHCGIIGFKRGGPYSHKPAYDSIIQGSTGLAAAIALQTGQPRFVPMVIADRTIGLLTAFHISMALYRRQACGEGAFVEIPMFENMAMFVLNEHMGGHSFEPQFGPPADLRVSDPMAAPIKTKDGYVCVTANTDKQAFALLDLIGRPELKLDPRFCSSAARYANVREFYQLRAEIFATRTTSEWLEGLDKADIPAMPYHSLDSLMDDPQLAASRLFSMVDHPQAGRIRTMNNPSTFPGADAVGYRPAPGIGENTIEVLREAGLTEDELRALIEEGVVDPPQHQ